MMFVLRMAVRETRASWRRLLFFFVCIAVGVAAIVALRSVIQSVRGVFGTRSEVADRRRRADLDQPRLDAGGARDHRPPPRRGRRHRRAPKRSRRRRWCGRRIGRRSVARMVELRAVQPAFPLYGTLDARRAGSPTRTRCSQNHGVLVRPELLTALGVAGRRSDRHRPGGVHDPRRDRERAGAAASASSASARACSSTSTICRRPACWRSAAARATCCSCACPTNGSSRWSRRCDDDFADDFVNARSYRSTDDADRPRFRSGGELPEPGRPGHRDPRRHRGLERDARVRPAEDAQHRGAEVPRRDAAAQIIAVYMLQVMTLGLAGSLLGVGARARRDRGDSAGARLVVDVAAGRGALRRHLERRAAGHRRSACSSRCCSRSCRCCRCGSSSRRCCCATRRARAAARLDRRSPRSSLVSAGARRG